MNTVLYELKFCFKSGLQAPQLKKLFGDALSICQLQLIMAQNLKILYKSCFLVNFLEMVGYCSNRNEEDQRSVGCVLTANRPLP